MSDNTDYRILHLETQFCQLVKRLALMASVPDGEAEAVRGMFENAQKLLPLEADFEEPGFLQRLNMLDPTADATADPTPDTRQSDVSDEEFEEIRQRFREAYTQNQPAIVLPPDIPVGAQTIIEALRAAHNALDQCCVMLIENGERTEQERMVLHTVALAAWREVAGVLAVFREAGFKTGDDG